MNNDLIAFFLTLIFLSIIYLCLKKSKYYNHDSIGYMFMYVSAPIFLLMKWILEHCGDYSKYLIASLIIGFGLYIIFNKKVKVQSNEQNDETIHKKTK